MGVTVAIIKPSGNGCNLQCNYCYVNGQSSKIHHMSIETAKKIVDELLSQNDVEEVEFLWHGGEPLLRGLPFFEEIFRYQKEVSDKRQKKFINAIQTNLTLLNNDWLDFFQKYNITLSSSLDGPMHLHDINRVKSNGQGTFQLVKEKIALALGRGFRVNILCVISKTNVDYPEEICKTFNSLGINHVGFLPCYQIYDGNVVYPSLSPGEYGRFITKVFNLFLTQKVNFQIREFEQFFGGVIGHPQDICSFTGHCNRFICIDYNGDVYSCDTSPQDDDHSFGNLAYNSLHKLLETEKYKNFSCDTANFPISCKMCEYFDHCHNGCYNMRPKGKYQFCEDRKIIFSYLETLVRTINVKGDFANVDTI